MACISQSAGLVSINDLDPLFTILEVKGPNGAEQSCLCVSVCERQRHREKESPCDCLLQLDEVLVCDSWGRWSNLSFIRPYWAVHRQVCVCVCLLYQEHLGELYEYLCVCVPKIHTVGSSLMGCAGYCAWTVIHACDFLHRHELICLISLTFKSFYIVICLHVYVQCLFTNCGV